MASNQGWMRPRGSGRIHYCLREHTLCRRWTVTYWFYRRFMGKRALEPRFVASQTGSRKMCVDCVRRYAQLNRTFGLPVEPPEPMPEFGG